MSNRTGTSGVTSPSPGVRQSWAIAQIIALFEAERQALAMMDHPNIAYVLEAGMLLNAVASVTPFPFRRSGACWERVFDTAYVEMASACLRVGTSCNPESRSIALSRCRRSGDFN